MNKIELKSTLPFFWPILKWKFGYIDADFNKLALAFGRTIYSGKPMDKTVLHHELVHIIQQKGSYFWGIIWWLRYLSSRNFRFFQEVAAYREQYRFGKTIIKDRNEINYFLSQLAQHLSGSIYNNMVDFRTAMDLIK